MTDADQREIALLCDEIDAYLRRRPSAADTLEGIVRWWLARDRTERSRDAVQRALDLLVARHRVKRTVNADGQVIYARADEPRHPGPRH